MANGYEQMKKQIEREQRILDEAHWYLDHRSSVRDVAENFGMSKSAVWHDFNAKLKWLDYDLYQEVLVLLSYNKKHCVEKMANANRLKKQFGGRRR